METEETTSWNLFYRIRSYYWLIHSLHIGQVTQSNFFNRSPNVCSSCVTGITGVNGDRTPNVPLYYQCYYIIQILRKNKTVLSSHIPRTTIFFWVLFLYYLHFASVNWHNGSLSSKSLVKIITVKSTSVTAKSAVESSGGNWSSNKKF